MISAIKLLSVFCVAIKPQNAGVIWLVSVFYLASKPHNAECLYATVSVLCCH
jgi:hypothetical protein